MLSVLIATGLAKRLDLGAIAAEVNRLNTSWVAGVNDKFVGMDYQSIVNLMGTLETPESMRLPPKHIVPLQAPDSFDPRQEWPKCESLKEVRDQSNCGSCWAFGAVQSMSDRICIASGQTDQSRISAQDLLSCCGLSCGNGCNGGFSEGAWSHFKNQGLSTGWLYGDKTWCKAYSLAPCSHHVNSSYPNCTGDSATPKCVRSCDSGSSRVYSNDIRKGKSVYSVPRTEAQIMTELMTHGPIEAAFTVYSDFLTYKSGVYVHTSGSALGGHAVKLMGWGVENGVKYWLVANSWNDSWGDKGFFKIRRGTNECGFQSQLVAGLV